MGGILLDIDQIAAIKDAMSSYRVHQAIHEQRKEHRHLFSHHDIVRSQVEVNLAVNQLVGALGEAGL